MNRTEVPPTAPYRRQHCLPGIAYDYRVFGTKPGLPPREGRELRRGPVRFQVRDKCRSVSLVQRSICPLCHGYRWRLTKTAVRRTALLIGRSPFPYTGGRCSPAGHPGLKQPVTHCLRKQVKGRGAGKTDRTEPIEGLSERREFGWVSLVGRG